MFSSTLALFTLVAPFVLAQSDNTQLEIDGIEANFQNAGLVPSLLATFDPVALLNVTFNGVGAISPGQNLTVDQVKPAPTLQVTPANSSVQLSDKYTLAMVDADIVGYNESSQTRHWLVNDVTINNGTPDLKSGKVITDYGGPFPAAGSGAHRYVILLYTQPSSFTPPSNLSSTTPVGAFNFASYVQSTGLQGPVAGMYMQVEQGVASMTVSSTAAVVTSTLAAATQTGSGSGANPTKTGAASSVYQGSVGVGLLGMVASFFL